MAYKYLGFYKVLAEGSATIHSGVVYYLNFYSTRFLH